MIGTASEMLLFFTYSHETAVRLGVTMSRLVKIRKRVAKHNFGEEALVEMLSKLDCKCIRPQYSIPAVIRDRTGKLFEEHAFIRTFLTQELCDKYGADFRVLTIVNNRGDYIERPMFRHVLHSRRATVVAERVVLESVWSYEPVVHMIDYDEIVHIQKMLHYNGETW